MDPPPNALSRNPPVVAAALRNQIIQGTDIELASLLRPSGGSFEPRSLDCGYFSIQLRHPAPTRSSILTPAELSLAFSIYRDVICSVFPSRRQELDDYLAVLLYRAVRFGRSLYYEYHRLFSARAAARLQQWSLSTYWGYLDLEPHFLRQGRHLLQHLWQRLPPRQPVHVHNPTPHALLQPRPFPLSRTPLPPSSANLSLPGSQQIHRPAWTPRPFLWQEHGVKQLQ